MAKWDLEYIEQFPTIVNGVRITQSEHLIIEADGVDINPSGALHFYNKEEYKEYNPYGYVYASNNVYQNFTYRTRYNTVRIEAPGTWWRVKRIEDAS